MPLLKSSGWSYALIASTNFLHLKELIHVLGITFSPYQGSAVFLLRAIFLYELSGGLILSWLNVFLKDIKDLDVGTSFPRNAIKVLLCIPLILNLPLNVINNELSYALTRLATLRSLMILGPFLSRLTPHDLQSRHIAAAYPTASLQETLSASACR
jgi:hypothetical protein